MVDAAFPRRRPAWPFLAALGLHLLLAWNWRIAHPPPPDLRGERVFGLVPVFPLSPDLPRLGPEPSPPPTTAPSKPRARSDSAKTDTVRAPEPITPPAEAPSTVADPFAITAPTAPAPSSLDAIGQAKRDALIIDREMRKGKSGVPEAADTPMGRFKEALEGAYKDRSLAIGTETYTAPDGQVIYRFRHGGRYRCRTGGSVGPKIGGAVGGGEVLFDVQGGGGRAGEIRCPSHADWKRD